MHHDCFNRRFNGFKRCRQNAQHILLAKTARVQTNQRESENATLAKPFSLASTCAG